MRVRARFAASFAALLAAFASAAGGQLFDPGLHWKTVESEHFRIHFAEGSEELAATVATVAERAHQRLGSRLGWSPREKTEVVLTDQLDFSNGFATPYPFNLMGLFVTPPEHGDVLAVDDLEQWLEEVVEHEYVHVLHLDRAAGAPRAVRRVFGRHLWTFPNAFQPLWGIEGLATHLEGDSERGTGRGEGSEFAMVMRTEVLHGVRSLAQVSLPNVTWPHGVLPYLYGQHFFDFLEKRYGPDAIRRLLEESSSNLIPFRVSGTFRRAFGARAGELWDQLGESLEERYRPQLDAIEAAGVVEGEPLTRGGFAAREHGGHSLQGTPEGTVYFVRDDGRRQPALMRRAADGTLAQLTRVRRGARFDAHPEAGILVAQPEVCREYGIYYDLYLLAPGERRLRRITRCSRYRSVAWSPDGATLAALRIELGRTDLHLLDSRGRPLRVLAEGAADELFSHPQWSPDGTRLLVVRSLRGEGADLWELELGTGTWHRLTDDRNAPVHPRYSHDGEAILFASDHGGVYNLRRLVRATGALETLTNTPTGALHPGEGASGEIFYLGYGPLGYDLHRLPGGTAALPTPAPNPRAAVAAPAPPAQLPIRPYSPLPSLRPRLWAPILEVGTEVNRLGAFTFGNDALGIHHYLLELTVDLDRGEPLGSASYQYADRLFTSASRTHEAFRGAWNGEGALVLRREEAQAAWRLPYTRLDSSWSLYLGGAIDRAALVGDGGLGRSVLRDDLAGAVLVYSDSRRPRLSISRQEGRTLRLAVESSIGDGDFSGEVLTLDWRELLHLGGTHVLALRAVHGWGSDAPRPFQLGGTRSAGLSLFNERRYALRGYAEGGPELRGRRLQLVSAEYRFPLGRPERGLMAPPVGVVQWSGTVFLEAGAAWDDGRPDHLHPAAGVEVILDAMAGFWLVPARVRLGYAHGFDRDAGGEDRLYLTLGTSF